MMRRFTSSPKPASREAAITSSTVPPGTATRSPNRTESNLARLLEASAGRIR